MRKSTIFYDTCKNQWTHLYSYCGAGEQGLYTQVHVVIESIFFLPSFHHLLKTIISNPLLLISLT